MKEQDINAFIEEMESIGDVWESEDVERVYGNSTLDKALSDRKSALGSFFDIIGKVINSKKEDLRWRNIRFN